MTDVQSVSSSAAGAHSATPGEEQLPEGFTTEDREALRRYNDAIVRGRHPSSFLHERKIWSYVRNSQERLHNLQTGHKLRKVVRRTSPKRDPMRALKRLRAHASAHRFMATNAESQRFKRLGFGPAAAAAAQHGKSMGAMSFGTGLTALAKGQTVAPPGAPQSGLSSAAVALGLTDEELTAEGGVHAVGKLSAPISSLTLAKASGSFAGLGTGTGSFSAGAFPGGPGNTGHSAAAMSKEERDALQRFREERRRRRTYNDHFVPPGTLSALWAKEHSVKVDRVPGAARAFSRSKRMKLYYGTAVALQNVEDGRFLTVDPETGVASAQHAVNKGWAHSGGMPFAARRTAPRFLFTVVNLTDPFAGSVVRYGDPMWLRVAEGPGDVTWKNGAVMGVNLRAAPKLGPTAAKLRLGADELVKQARAGLQNESVATAHDAAQQAAATLAQRAAAAAKAAAAVEDPMQRFRPSPRRVTKKDDFDVGEPEAIRAFVPRAGEELIDGPVTVPNPSGVYSRDDTGYAALVAKKNSKAMVMARWTMRHAVSGTGGGGKGRRRKHKGASTLAGTVDAASVDGGGGEALDLQEDVSSRGDPRRHALGKPVLNFAEVYFEQDWIYLTTEGRGSDRVYLRQQANETKGLPVKLERRASWRLLFLTSESEDLGSRFTKQERLMFKARSQLLRCVKQRHGATTYDDKVRSGERFTSDLRKRRIAKNIVSEKKILYPEVRKTNDLAQWYTDKWDKIRLPPTTLPMQHELQGASPHLAFAPSAAPSEGPPSEREWANTPSRSSSRRSSRGRQQRLRSNTTAYDTGAAEQSERHSCAMCDGKRYPVDLCAANRVVEVMVAQDNVEVHTPRRASISMAASVLNPRRMPSSLQVTSQSAAATPSSGMTGTSSPAHGVSRMGGANGGSRMRRRRAQIVGGVKMGHDDDDGEGAASEARMQALTERLLEEDKYLAMNISEDMRRTREARARSRLRKPSASKSMRYLASGGSLATARSARMGATSPVAGLRSPIVSPKALKSTPEEDGDASPGAARDH